MQTASNSCLLQQGTFEALALDLSFMLLLKGAQQCHNNCDNMPGSCRVSINVIAVLPVPVLCRIGKQLDECTQCTLLSQQGNAKAENKKRTGR